MWSLQRIKICILSRTWGLSQWIQCFLYEDLGLYLPHSCKKDELNGACTYKFGRRGGHWPFLNIELWEKIMSFQLHPCLWYLVIEIHARAWEGYVSYLFLYILLSMFCFIYMFMYTVLYSLGISHHFPISPYTFFTPAASTLKEFPKNQLKTRQNKQNPPRFSIFLTPLHSVQWHWMLQYVT